MSGGDLGRERSFALRRQAKGAGRPTAELLQLSALEGFLARVERSPHRSRLVLKGGVLLSAFALRRPTRDLDFLALHTDNDPAAVGRLVRDVAAVPVEDGLQFFPDTVQTELIREGDVYPGVRRRLLAALSTARLHVQIDLNVGDPLEPPAELTTLPSLISGPGPTVWAYPRAMVVAEKLVTALQRGPANTRWRDFADLHLLLVGVRDDLPALGPSVAAVAHHRGVPLAPLADVLGGMAAHAQPRWAAWVQAQGLAGRVPLRFDALLADLDAATRALLHGAGGTTALASPQPSV